MKQPGVHPLQVARAQRNLTRKRLAEEVGVGEATIGRAEHNKPVSSLPFTTADIIG
jgi:DNA-binding XRE family transcriptional regulator